MSSKALPSLELLTTLIARVTEEDVPRASLTVRVRVTRPTVFGALQEVVA
jgi:hypothetical protein